MRKGWKKGFGIMLILAMILTMMPMTALAEAGDWDPLYDPDLVKGQYVEDKTFSASDDLVVGIEGHLRTMPILNDYSSGYSYNAMAYCGAEAVSGDSSIVEIKSIEIGTVSGGDWDGADCLQVTVTPKKIGRTTVTIGYYYTFSQSAKPFDNPNAQWFYGTTY